MALRIDMDHVHIQQVSALAQISELVGPETAIEEEKGCSEQEQALLEGLE